MDSVPSEQVAPQPQPPQSQPKAESHQALGLVAGLLVLLAVLGYVTTAMDQQNIPSEQVPVKQQAPTFNTFESLVTSDAAVEEHIKRVVDGIDPTQIRTFMKEFSRVPHIAGSKANTKLAHDAAANFKAFGFDHVETQTIPVMLANYSYRGVNVTSTADTSFFYSCQLNEDDVMLQDEWDNALKPANGYSGTGVAEGHVVWANYGRKEDFDAISHVDLKGRIVAVRYGKIFRGDKAHQAEARGAVGVIIVNDPHDVGPSRGKTFPNGPWAANTTVQRGSVYKGEGDPLTPTWPSEFGGPTLAKEDLFNQTVMDGWALPSIPVQPMGWGDAMKLLQNIGGSPTINPLPATWHNTGFQSLIDGGIGPGHAKVRMEVRRELQVKNITNVFATIYGSVEPDRTVLIGSHRDAWTYGAEDPISGHSIVQEIARNVGKLRKTGWKPRRTLQVCSWDAEEWALIGSVEYVEGTLELLRQRAVAYLNLDVAVSGNMSLYNAGSPLLRTLTESAAARVPIPGQRTLADIMSTYDSIGSGSDHAGFIQLAGVPVLLSAIFDKPDQYQAVYHSNHDDLYWVDHFGDPGFVYHKAMAQMQSIILLSTLESTMLPYHMADYANSIIEWGNDYQTPQHGFADFTYLNTVSKLFQQSAASHDALVTKTKQVLKTAPGSISPYEVRRLNDISMGVERVFLAHGKKETGQPWYRHVIFTPSEANSYKATKMPLIAIGLETKQRKDANFAIGRVGQFIRRAALFANSSFVAPYPM